MANELAAAATFKVDNILASEECKIVKFTVDIETGICIVTTENTLSWMSGTAPCKSTSTSEHMVNGDNIFHGITETLYNAITKG